MQHSALVAFW